VRLSRELMRVLMPSRIIMMAPARVMYRRNKSALFKSQPVTLPINSIGDMAVPRPNRTAKAMLSRGLAKGIE
jgi:hypothetical protein